MILAAAAKTTSGGSSLSLLLPLLLVVVAYFLIIRPRSQQMKRTQAQSREVNPGDRVMTTSGMLGRVVKVGDETVLIEVAPDVQLSFVRRAISRRVDDDDPIVTSNGSNAAAEAEADYPADPEGSGDETEHGTDAPEE